MNITISEMKGIVDQIRKLLDELNSSFKMSVTKATEIGEHLLKVKETLDHGDFLPWLKSNFEMSDETARKYIKLHQYKSKIQLNWNLQDAYKQISQIEHQEKKKREKKDLEIIFEYKRTKKKPKEWDRRHDNLYKKMLDDEEYAKRKQGYFKPKEDDRPAEPERGASEMLDELKTLYGKIVGDRIQVVESKEKLKLNVKEEDNVQTAVFMIIDEYLDSIDDMSRRIETAQNVIKYLRGKIVQMQRI